MVVREKIEPEPQAEIKTETMRIQKTRENKTFCRDPEKNKKVKQVTDEAMSAGSCAQARTSTERVVGKKNSHAKEGTKRPGLNRENEKRLKKGREDHTTQDKFDMREEWKRVSA